MNPSVASRILAPSSEPPGGSSNYDRDPQYLANADGSIESSNPRRLPENSMVTLVVGATPIRATWRKTKGVSSAVANTDLIIPAFSSYTWTVDPLTQYIYIEAMDTSTGYEAWLWKSS